MRAAMRTFLRGAVLTVVAAVAVHAQTVATSATSQTGKGRLITPADIRAWNSIRANVLSADGKWFAYVVGSSESEATLVLRGTAKDAKETRINVGNGGGSPQISGDSKWMGYLVAPPRPANGAAGRGGARGGGGGGGRGGLGGGAPGGAQQGDSTAGANAATNTFVLRNLATGEEKRFERIRRFSYNTDDVSWIAMQGYTANAAPTEGAAPAGRGGGRGGRGGAPAGPAGAESGAGANLLLYNIASAETFNMGEVNQYAFNDDGDWLAYTMSTPDQVGNGLQLRNMNTNVIRSIESDRLLYSHLAWVDSSRAISVMRGKIAGRDTVFSIEVFRDLTANGAARRMLFTPEGRTDFPGGWKLASERAPNYSADMNTVYFGIREGVKPGARGQTAGRGAGGLVQPGAPGAGGTINQTAAGRGAGGAAADELPSLVLWHYKDPRLQSQQIVQEAQDRAFNYLSEYRFADNKFIKLTDDRVRTVSISAGEKFAYATDNTDYQERASYTGRNYADYYTVDLTTGARKLLWKKRPGGGGGGGGGGLNVSPDATKALYWGTDGNYWVLDLKTHDTLNITKGVPTSFVNTEDDHNNIYPPAIAPHGWTRDSKAVLLSDNWDIWKVSVTPGVAPVNLTGNGKKDQIRYQTIYQWADEAASAGGRGGRGGRGGGRGGRGGGGGGGGGEGIDLTKPIHVSTYGEWTKKEGLARLDPGVPGAKQIFFEDARFAIEKAKNADTYVYTRQTFTDYPNYWVFNPNFAGGYQITDVNPQIKELAWSSGTRLVDYKSDKGDKLQAALYLPANFDSTKKYPMLVTIYEKRSQQKNGFVSPSETRAPDPSLFTNRGYIVMDPDIVYRVNDPGMSAVWCVVPAVKAAIAKGYVDDKHVGLWGHSWGGYQTAFLVTQTNIFAGAIAGAPLTNMISMDGSIYWNTGGSDAAIFEASQGRFKGVFTENLDAYVRNSPVYFANNVKTPLIILQNDKDGAVDFNQGVTYFNTLRTLGKNVIFLEYVGENHGLQRPVNQKDYAQRMGEFFDYHLKDAKPSDWILNGVPRLQMDEHLRSRLDTTAVPGRIIIP